MKPLTKIVGILILACWVLPAAAFQPGDGPRERAGGPEGADAWPRMEDQGREQGRDGSRTFAERGRPMTEAEIELALSTLKEIDPEAAKHLEQVRRDKPDEFVGEMRRRFPRVREMVALKRLDAVMFELRVQDLKLVRESREAAEALVAAREGDQAGKAGELTDRLRALVEKHFDIRQKIRTRELERLEARLEQLREQLEARADAKDQLIDQQVSHLTGGGASDW